MPLSEHEQRLLEQMEKALYAEDPKFATSLRSTPGARAARGRAALGVLAVLGDSASSSRASQRRSSSSAYWASPSCWPARYSSTRPSMCGPSTTPRRRPRNPRLGPASPRASWIAWRIAGGGAPRTANSNPPAGSASAPVTVVPS